MADHRGSRIHPLVWIEAVAAFAPISIFLMIGLFMSPFQWFFLLVSPEARADPEGALQVIGFSVFGALALGSLINLIVAMGDPANAFLGRTATLGFGTIGVLILCHLIADSSSLPWRIFFALPLIVAFHIAYLARSYLFDRTSGPVPPGA